MLCVALTTFTFFLYLQFLDLSAPAVSLGGHTLILEARAVFRLEIPSLHKTLGVRVKLGKVLKDVLKTVCSRYSLKLDSYACWPEVSRFFSFYKLFSH